MFDDIHMEIIAGTSTDNGLDPDDPGYEKRFEIASQKMIRLSKPDMAEISDDVRQQLHAQLDKALDDINRNLARR